MISECTFSNVQQREMNLLSNGFLCTRVAREKILVFNKRDCTRSVSLGKNKKNRPDGGGYMPHFRNPQPSACSGMQIMQSHSMNILKYSFCLVEQPWGMCFTESLLHQPWTIVLYLWILLNE